MASFFDNLRSELDRKRRGFERREKAVEGFSSVLDSLKDRLGSADRRAGMSVRDLYGDSIDRSSDQVRANANATKESLSRLGSARGDDPTGGQNVALNRIDERANRNISDIIQYYTDRASTDQEQARARGDRLSSMMMGGEMNLANLAEQEIMRALQKEQARKQRQVDLFSALTGGLSRVLAPGPSSGGE